MSLSAGHFRGPMGAVIAPFSGLSGSLMRDQTARIAVGGGLAALDRSAIARMRVGALGGLGSLTSTLCTGGAIATSAGTAYASSTKASSAVNTLLSIGTAVVGGACPSSTPSQQTQSPATTAVDNTTAQLAAAQAALAASQALQIQQQTLASKAAAAQGGSSGGKIDTKTLAMVGGGVGLLALAWFLLK